MPLGEDLFGLLQVSCRAVLRQTGLELYQPSDHRVDVSHNTHRAAVREDFGVKLEATRCVLVTGCGSRIASHCDEEAVGNVILAIVPRPEMVVRELVADHRL